ncbi:MAG: hypothetical protein ACE5JK_01955 [Candidatus Omnitrophota bacterium]
MDVRKYIKEIKKYYKIQKCRECECLQGFLVQLEIDGVDEKTMKKIKKMILTEGIHKCLGCDPCPPAEIFTKYLMEKDKK